MVDKVLSLQEETKKVIVIGVGNLLLKDEGVGVHVARELQRIKLPPPS